MTETKITEAAFDKAFEAFESTPEWRGAKLGAALEAANLEAVREAGELRTLLAEKRAAEVKLIEELAATRQQLAYRTSEADFLAAKLGQERTEICKALASANTPRPLHASQKLAELAASAANSNIGWTQLWDFFAAFANWMEGRDV